MTRSLIFVSMLAVAGSLTGGCMSSTAQPVGKSQSIGQTRADPTIPGLDHKNKIVDARARAIVAAMFATYANCRTYSDTGTSVWESTKLTFLTRFKRPDRIYFEFTAEHGNVRPDRFVLWAQGTRKKIWFDGVDGPGYWDDTVLTNSWYGDSGELRKDGSLGMAVAGFTGISSGTAATVPTLLFPKEISMLCLGDMKDLKVEGTAMDRGVECVVVVSIEHYTRAWVDKESHLLRRIAESYEGEPEQIVEYLPQTDGAINDELMVFVPPGSNGSTASPR